jgi:hypothetical protein
MLPLTIERSTPPARRPRTIPNATKWRKIVSGPRATCAHAEVLAGKRGEGSTAIGAEANDPQHLFVRFAG